MFPLIPVAFTNTTIFVSDTYLLNSSIGIYLIFYILFKNYEKILTPLVFLYAIFLFFQTQSYVKIYLDDYVFWKYSYEKEPTIDSTLNFAIDSLRVKKFDQSLLLLRQVQKWSPNDTRILPIVVKNYFYNPKLTPLDKIKYLESIHPLTPISAFYLSILYSNLNLKEKLDKVLHFPFLYPKAFLVDLSYEAETVLATYMAICEKNLVTNTCSQNITNFNKIVKFEAWKNELYTETLQAHRKDLNNIIYSMPAEP
jgi:hypothetical protein